MVRIEVYTDLILIGIMDSSSLKESIFSCRVWYYTSLIVISQSVISFFLSMTTFKNFPN
jgi:hypothetical protein